MSVFSSVEGLSSVSGRISRPCGEQSSTLSNVESKRRMSSRRGRCRCDGEKRKEKTLREETHMISVWSTCSIAWPCWQIEKQGSPPGRPSSRNVLLLLLFIPFHSSVCCRDISMTRMRMTMKSICWLRRVVFLIDYSIWLFVSLEFSWLNVMRSRIFVKWTIKRSMKWENLSFDFSILLFFLEKWTDLSEWVMPFVGLLLNWFNS
jgi:hypothetical protein